MPSQDGPQPQDRRSNAEDDECRGGDHRVHQERRCRLAGEQRSHAGAQNQEDPGPQPGRALEEPVQAGLPDGRLPQRDDLAGQFLGQRFFTARGPREQDAQHQVGQREVQKEDPQVASADGERGLERQDDHHDHHQARHGTGDNLADDGSEPGGAEAGQQPDVAPAEVRPYDQGGDREPYRFDQVQGGRANQAQRRGEFKILAHRVSVGAGRMRSVLALKMPGNRNKTLQPGHASRAASRR
jgi:hypothetical protein